MRGPADVRIAIRNSGSQQVVDVRRFDCALCGWGGEAVVVGHGARSVVPWEEAQQDLVRTLSLARCPRCHGRDPGAARRFAIRVLGVAAVATGVTWLGLGVLSQVAPIPLVVSWPLGPLAAIWTVRLRGSLRGIDRRVRFIGRTER